MPRSALYALLPSLLLAFFFVHRQHEDRLQRQEIHSLERALELTKPELSNSREMAENLLSYHLRDDSKARFASILLVTEKLGKLNDEFTTLLTQLQQELSPTDFQTTWQELLEIATTARITAGQLITQQGTDFDLQAEEVAKFRTQIENPWERLQNDLSTSTYHRTRSLLTPAESLGYQVRFETAHLATVNQFSAIMGGKVLLCFPQLVALYPERAPNRPGDPFGFYVVVDVSSNERGNYNHVALTINGQPYLLDGFGVARFAGTYHPGQELDIQLRIVNLLTGETEEREYKIDPSLIDEWKESLQFF